MLVDHIRKTQIQSLERRYPATLLKLKTLLLEAADTDCYRVTIDVNEHTVKIYQRWLRLNGFSYNEIDDGMLYEPKVIQLNVYWDPEMR